MPSSRRLKEFQAADQQEVKHQQKIDQPRRTSASNRKKNGKATTRTNFNKKNSKDDKESSKS